MCPLEIGDGVENAFSFSRNVMTLSLHNFEAGYFPGSGNVSSVGFGKGKYFAVNVPLKGGITDRQFVSVFSE
jgi:histone deacetylase 8